MHEQFQKQIPMRYTKVAKQPRKQTYHWTAHARRNSAGSATRSIEVVGGLFFFDDEVTSDFCFPGRSGSMLRPTPASKTQTTQIKTTKLN